MFICKCYNLRTDLYFLFLTYARADPYFLISLMTVLFPVAWLRMGCSSPVYENGECPRTGSRYCRRQSSSLAPESCGRYTDLISCQ